MITPSRQRGGVFSCHFGTAWVYHVFELRNPTSRLNGVLIQDVTLLLNKKWGRKMNMKITAAVSAASVALSFANVANAAVITSLAGATALPIPAVNLLHTSAVQTIAAGITAAPTVDFTYGYTGSYGFPSNTSWIGTPMIGLDRSSGSFSINFAASITAFLGELNWTTGQSAGNATIEIYDSANLLLESLTLEVGGVNAVAPGFYGFQRGTADIAKIVFSNEYIGVRNISTSAVSGAVPETATWAMMLVGFGAVGGTLRYRRRKTAVSFS
jgi:hypothetical protein